MVIYTIYVKTHLKTGLKYLGFTKKKDPYKYKGSGKYWIRHIKKYGEDAVWTNIIFQTEIKQDIKDMGLYYSELWNVVESVEWANMRPESGDGGHGFILTPKENSLIKKEWWSNIENKKIMKDIHNSPETKLKKSAAIKVLWKDTDFRKQNTFYCESCNRHIVTKTNWNKHMKSKKHFEQSMTTTKNTS